MQSADDILRELFSKPAPLPTFADKEKECQQRLGLNQIEPQQQSLPTPSSLSKQPKAPASGKRNKERFDVPIAQSEEKSLLPSSLLAPVVHQKDQDLHKSSQARSTMGDYKKTSNNLEKHKKRTRESAPQDAKKNNKRRKNKEVPEAPICKYYKQGTCLSGNACPYRHEGAVEQHKGEICKFFLSDACSKGDACQFSHDLSIFPCKFLFLGGSCNWGKRCRFSHEQPNEEAMQKLLLHHKDDFVKSAESEISLPQTCVAEKSEFDPFSGALTAVVAPVNEEEAQDNDGTNMYQPFSPTLKPVPQSLRPADTNQNLSASANPTKLHSTTTTAAPEPTFSLGNIFDLKK